MRSSPDGFPIKPTAAKLKFSPTLAVNEQVAALRKEGRPVYNLGFGQCPFPVHNVIKDALGASADKNMYLPVAGLPELREAALHYFSKKFQFDPDLFTAIIGPGSKELIYDVQLAVEGDLLHPVPSWVSYAPQAQLIRDQVIHINASVDSDYHISGQMLENAIVQSRKTGKQPRKLILNYPNNPSGLSLTPEKMKEIAAICRKYEILIISDEIYGLVDFRKTHRSIAGFYPEGTVITTGLSKHLSLGGYRLGVAIVPRKESGLFNAICAIASETFSSVASPVQFAALKAFEEQEDLETYITACTKMQSLASNYFRRSLTELGIHYPELNGSFYLYPDFQEFEPALNKIRQVYSSDDLVSDLLRKTGVATLPGSAFGEQSSVLRLRAALCDFDGGFAWQYFSQHPNADMDEFVSQCCPNIVMACEQFVKYFQQLS